jgi:hypothetical protein
MVCVGEPWLCPGIQGPGTPEIMIAAGMVVALVGVAVGIFGLRARRSGTWTLG